ncbi:MAG TPA: TatD family hydrolase [Acidimicrobiales bacterium]|nr:TatD family hydrolase [Acidimicrobiales bacterium]
MAWIDNHCHLRADDEAAISEAREAGVVRLITVGTDLERSLTAIRVAKAHDNVWATAGVHPHDATQGIDGIAALLDHPKVVAVGEAGLDYYYDHSPRDVQQSVFAAQIALAHAHDLPLVIHTRDAWDDTFRILDREGTPRRTVFHCFTGGPLEAAAAVERGACLSISGIVTFKTADDLRAAVAQTPLEHLFVETDSPYLAPVPHRGKANRPAWVPLVGSSIATVKACTVAEVEAVTWANACSFYGLDP